MLLPEAGATLAWLAWLAARFGLGARLEIGIENRIGVLLTY